MDQPENTPAFPRSDGGYSPTQDGMTLRDWFAGQALSGMLADPNVNTKDATSLNMWCRAVARMSFTLADALLAERSK